MNKYNGCAAKQLMDMILPEIAEVFLNNDRVGEARSRIKIQELEENAFTEAINKHYYFETGDGSVLEINLRYRTGKGKWHTWYRMSLAKYIAMKDLGSSFLHAFLDKEEK